ncbi:MAG TPA: hypothetical protein VGN23_06100 [Verrucomicrobiae bacterium]|jgi:hypothetical protein
MKKTFLLSVIAALFVVGCGDKSSSSNPSTQSTNAAPKVATAPANPAPPSSVNYLGTLVAAQQSADKKLDTAYLNQAIQNYNVDQGHYPKTLQDLVPNYIGKIPQPPLGYQLKYDPKAGSVTVVQQQ